jgi:hypothetical protein
MKKIYALLGIALLLIGTVAVGTITVNELYKKVAPTTCEEFLSVGYIWLPKDVSNIFMEDRIVLHFSMINGNEITVYGTVKSGAISKLQCDPFSNHDFEVWMSDLNALELATSEKPITTFVTLWRNDQIRLKANGKDNEKKLAYADQLVARDNEPVPVRIRNIFNKFIE